MNPLTYEGNECQHGYMSDCPSCDAPSYLPDPFSPEPDMEWDAEGVSEEEWLASALVVDPFSTEVDDWDESYWR